MAAAILPSPTWLVGCGNMAGAMVDGWRAADVELTNAVAIRPSGTPVDGVRTVTSVSQAGPPPRFVLLGFKPQQLDAVAPELAPRLSARTVVVSILAGVELSSLRRRFPGAAAIVRVLPNLPVAVRRGVMAIYSDDASDAVRAELSPVFAALGYALWTNSEAKLAAVGSVAGAGPAYVARFVDGLTKAGVQRGLDPEVAATIALETVFGTAWMAAASGEDMGRIASRVASPNGTTEAGLAVLDPALEGLIGRTIEAAAARGAELAEEARLP